MESNTDSSNGAEQEEIFVPAIEISDIIELKEQGNWDRIKALLESGQVDILPINLIEELAKEKVRYNKLIQLLQALINASKPLSENSDALLNYLDPAQEGFKKIKWMRLSQEMMGAIPVLTMGGTPHMPLLEILKNGLDFSHLKAIDGDEMLQVLDESGVDYQSIVDLLNQLQLFSPPSDSV